MDTGEIQPSGKAGTPFVPASGSSGTALRGGGGGGGSFNVPPRESCALAPPVAPQRRGIRNENTQNEAFSRCRLLVVTNLCRSGAVLVYTAWHWELCLGLVGEIAGEGKSLITLSWLMPCFSLVHVAVRSWI